LLFGEVPVTKLAEQVSTPFYAYSGDAVVAKVRGLKAALGADTDIFYSIKANPSLGICQLMAKEGVGAELASIGELILAKKAGFAPENIIFAGPGKTNDELEMAAAMGISAINAESAGEIERLAEIAKRLGVVARVSLRINPASALKGAQMRMGGGPQQFGIDEEQAPEVLNRFAGHPNLEFVGVHVYAGTQMADTEAVLANCRNTLEVAKSVSERLERPVQELDFGGGFAVPYFENSPEFDLPGFAEGYRALVTEAKKDQAFGSTRFIIELGRYLVAEAGVYVTRVVDVKWSRGKKYIVTDGGMNHHITATGNFGQVFRKAYPIAVVNNMDGAATDPAAVVGPCCTPLDVLGTNLELPDVSVGDLIGVFYSGAYGYSASSLNFLSHPTPAEVMVLGGQTHVLRKIGRPDQVLDGQLEVQL
jgi:diaminopimelate decarboxylase